MARKGGVGAGIGRHTVEHRQGVLALQSPLVGVRWETVGEGNEGVGLDRLWIVEEGVE